MQTTNSIMDELNNSQMQTNSDLAFLPIQKHPFLKVLGKGLVLSLPLLIFVSLVYLGIKLVLKLVAPLTLLLASGTEVPPWYLHILSLIIILGFIMLVGLLPRYPMTSSWAKRFKVQYLMHLPFYPLIEDTVQQFSGLKKMPFSQVVLVDPYASGVLLTGFVSEEVNEDLYTVFVPTAPNPLNGNIYHVPKSKLTLLDISPDVAMRTIVGMGNGSNYLFPHLKTAGETAKNMPEIGA